MSNPFESGQQKIIPAVLLYAFHGDQVLMIHRNLKDQDFHEGKWNGLGGKLELSESPLDAAVREFEEEAFCKTEPAQWNWTGQLYFPDFKPHKHEDWWVTVYTVTLTDEQVKQIPIKTAASAEGTLHWIARNEVVDLNLWDGDREFIPHVMSETVFEGTFYYENGKCTRHTLKTISSRR